MASDGYEKIDTTDPEDNLPPPPVRLEPEESNLPIPLPPPPSESPTDQLRANSTTEAATGKPSPHGDIKGTQLVKVSSLKLLSEDLSSLGLTEGELYLATEAAGDQLQISKPEEEAEKKLLPRKAFKIIDKKSISKSEKYELAIKSVQSYDSVLLDACLSQGMFSAHQKGLTRNGGNLFHIAAAEGEPHALLRILNGREGKGSELMLRDSNGYTLLHAAVGANKMENIEVILDHANTLETGSASELINAQDNSGNTALAISISEQNPDAANLLLRGGLCELGIANKMGETVFHVCARVDDVETIRSLMQSYLDKEPFQERKIGLKDELCKQTSNGLMPVTMSHSPEMIRLLLPNYELNGAEYPQQSTLLHRSVSSNNVMLTEILLEEGSDPGATTSLGQTPLMQACRAGYKEVALLILEKGADPEQILSSSDQCECAGTAIEMAALSGHLECVKILLQFSASVSGDETTPPNRIGALQAACLGGDEQTVSFFVKDQTMDANLRNNSGRTPLFYAVRGGHHSVVELLLSSGADPSAGIVQQKGNETSSLLHMVVEQDSEKILSLLLSHSKLDDTESLLDLAIRLDRKRLLPHFVTSNQDILHSGRQSGSLLHSAVLTQSIGALTYFLNRLSKSCQENAMHFQIFERKASILAKSKSSGYPDISQKTVFELAVAEKSESMLSLLLVHLRDEEYFSNNKALLHAMLDSKLYVPLKTAMDTMVTAADDRVLLQTAYLDSDSTGLLPTNPDYQESERSLLHKLVSCPDQDLVYHCSVTAAVTHKLPYYRALFIASALFYILFLLLLTLALHNASYVCDRDLFDYQRDPFRLFCEIIVGIFFVLYVAYEVLGFLIEWDPLRGRYDRSRQNCNTSVTYVVETTNEYRIPRTVHRIAKFVRCAVVESWHKLNQITRGLFSASLSYFLNPFRLLAFLSLFCLFFFFMLRLGMSNSQWTFGALSLLLFYLSLLEYSKIVPSFYCYLLRTLRACFQALPPFLLLLTICVLAFVLAGHVFIQQDAIQLSENRTNNCLPQRSFLQDLYLGTNRLFVASLSLLLQSGISSYEDRFVFRDSNWIFLLFLLCFGFLFAVLLPAFLLAHVLFSFTQNQGGLSLQRCKLDIIHRTELHSGFAFLFGRRVRSSTCVEKVCISKQQFKLYLETVDSKRETEILVAMRSSLGRVLYSSQGPLRKKPVPSPSEQTEESDSSLKGIMQQLRTEIQENSSRTNLNVNSMLSKMEELDRRVATIHDYLTGVSVEIVT